MGKMKKAIIWIIVIASLYGFTACGKKQEEQKASIQEWIVQYPLENILAYTVVYCLDCGLRLHEQDVKTESHSLCRCSELLTSHHNKEMRVTLSNGYLDCRRF